MKTSKPLNKIQNELPSRYADRLGQEYGESVNQKEKKERGQFFTPVEIASFMASFSDFKEKSVRILDPGSGIAILSCSLIEHLLQINPTIHSVELMCYETDLDLLPFLNQSLKNLNEWLSDKGVIFNFTVHTKDFILHTASCLLDSHDLFLEPIAKFDIVISNPPYFKLSIDDPRVQAAKVLINGHPNIYSIFMAISARLLKENGELIFITPRSYASGGYFKTFREFFFQLVELTHVHLFVSRKETFSRDKVLQETVIIKGIRQHMFLENTVVSISSSAGLMGLDEPNIRTFPKKDIIDLSTNEKILHLPTSDYEESVMDIFKTWSGTLSKYNIKISTGPVVAFRAWDYIKEKEEVDDAVLAPLFWLHNIKKMALEWPIDKPQKGQFISVDTDSRPLLIPNKNYILLRRFSSKDDKSRLIAAPYFSQIPNTDYIGVENKVNYIYRPGGLLERDELVGLCALLNSNFFDSYFRMFNGNVNVSATELREMLLPPLETIKEIGNTIILSNDYSVEHVNKIMTEYFEPEYIK